MDTSPTRRSHPASTARIVRATGLCVALGAAVLWVLSDSSGGHPSSVASSSSSSFPSVESFFVGTDPSLIDRIEVSFPSGTAHQLRREAKGWEISDGGRWFPINPDRESSLFGASGSGTELFAGITGLLQGSNPANHDRAFGVSPRQGVTVTFYSGARAVEEMIVGRAVRTSSGWGTYVRRPESNAVYQLPGKLTDNFAGESIYTWRRRFLFPGVTPGDILEVDVSHLASGMGYTLARTPLSATGWNVTSGLLQVEADPQIANALCEWIVRLRTADFLEESILVAESDPIAQISLRIDGYVSPVQLIAHRDDMSSAIIRLQLDSPREGESSVLGVFDLLPLWRDPAELVWESAPSAGVIADDRPGANEPFALGAGEKF